MMKAIAITEFGGPEVLKPVSIEKPAPGPGEVLIKIAAAGVNRPDVIQRTGNYPAPPGASEIPGLEVAGHIVESGAGVTAWHKGDAVCALVAGGGYAEYCLAPAANTLSVPEGMDMIMAASLPETFFTVWSNVFDRAALKAGEIFLVHGGTSGIGTTAIQLAKAFGATVFTTAGSDEKCQTCLDLGADYAVNYKSTDYEKEIKEKAGREGVNVILDMVGGDYIQKNINLLAPDGRLVQIAFLQGPKTSINMLPVMLKRLTVTGSTLRPRDVSFKADIAAQLKQKVWPLLESGTVKPVIDSTFPLEDASKAHERIESSGHIGKIILTVS